MDPVSAILQPRLITRKSLRAQGFEPYEINTRIRRGELLKIAKGSYVDPVAVGGSFPEVVFRLKSLAHAERSPQLVVSHQSALAVHGVELYGINWNQVHLTRSGRNGADDAGHRVVHASILNDDEVVVIDGARVTSVARSLIDFARGATFESAVVAMDSALRRGLVTAEELAAALARLRGRSGSPAARRALLFADHRSESVGESRLRVMMHSLQLPAPVSQVEIFDERKQFVGRVDLAYPDLAVLIEFDGEVKYQPGTAEGRSASDVVIAERQRERKLVNLGYEVVRFSWADLRNPKAVRAEIIRALGLAKRRLGADRARGTWRQAA